MKNAHVPDLLYALSICLATTKILKNQTNNNQNIKKCMFDNEFHLLLNTTNILMHVSFGIIIPNISCAVFDGHRKFEDTHKM